MRPSQADEAGDPREAIRKAGSAGHAEAGRGAPAARDSTCEARSCSAADEHQAYPRERWPTLEGPQDLHARADELEAKARTTRESAVPREPVRPADPALAARTTSGRTIAFSKRRQSAMYRMAIWAVWRNYVKDRSENRAKGTPAQALGIAKRALSVREVLARRRFPEREKISGWLAECYFGRIPTRAIENCRVHEARYAI